MEQEQGSGAVPASDDAVAAFTYAHFLAGVRGETSKHLAEHTFGVEVVRKFANEKLEGYLDKWVKLKELVTSCPECVKAMLGEGTPQEMQGFVQKIAQALGQTLIANGTEASIVKVDPDEVGRELKVVTPQSDDAVVGFLMAASVFRLPREMGYEVANQLWGQEKVTRVAREQHALCKQVEAAELGQPLLPGGVS